MKKLIAGVLLSTTIGTASAMPTLHATAPVPAQHMHVHYSSFDRNTYMLGGMIIGVTLGVLVWAITDHYTDPTHYSVRF